MRLYFDIETIPSQHPEAMERARAAIKPPGNMKKAETIAAWWSEEGERAILDAYQKQALDAAEGEVAALAYALDHHPPKAWVRKKGEGEADFLQKALQDMAAAVDGHLNQYGDARFPESPYLIAHNAMFDIGFIRRRCMVHGIRPPTWFPSMFARDGWDYGDTMTLWAGPRERISLDRLCLALGIESPKSAGVDGAGVFGLWQAERYEEIARYNTGDVLAVRNAWLRMNFEESPC